MSVYYIELADGECINLSESQVDEVNYDNNHGYNVYSLAICDDEGNVERTFDFATREARDDFAEGNGLDYQNGQWLYDVETWDITKRDGDREERIPCLCDVQIDYYC